MKGSTFSSGSDVEVNFQKEDLYDAWFPAIVIKENEDNTFYVKYKNPVAMQGKDNVDFLKDNVDFLHVRPSPPCYTDRSYKLLDKVEALCDFAWRVGVITKVLAERMYAVNFKHGRKVKELSHSEIRPLVEWKDGKWNIGYKV